MDDAERMLLPRNQNLTSADRQRLFESFWRAWEPRVRVYLRCFRQFSMEDREELAADILLRAFDHAATYHPVRPLSPWLYTIARRMACDRIRSARKHTGQTLFSASESLEDQSRPGPEAHFIAEELRREVAAYLDRLPEKERELAFLVYSGGLKLSEAAYVTGNKLGTVKWRLFRIREGLRFLLEEHNEKTV
jgi:RNA polymerase sigma-70 factor (ECF subfamily)